MGKNTPAVRGKKPADGDAGGGDPRPRRDDGLTQLADAIVPKRKTGRRSKAEEIAEYLAEHGIEIPDDAEPSGAAPETFLEMRDELMKLVWLNRASLKGIALVQALKALATLAEANRGEDEAKGEPEPLIADVLAGIPGLPVERRDEILRRELGKLDAERERVLQVLGASAPPE